MGSINSNFINDIRIGIGDIKPNVTNDSFSKVNKLNILINKLITNELEFTQQNITKIKRKFKKLKKNLDPKKYNAVLKALRLLSSHESKGKEYYRRTPATRERSIFIENPYLKTPSEALDEEISHYLKSPGETSESIHDDEEKYYQRTPAKRESLVVKNEKGDEAIIQGKTEESESSSSAEESSFIFTPEKIDYLSSWPPILNRPGSPWINSSSKHQKIVHIPQFSEAVNPHKSLGSGQDIQAYGTYGKRRLKRFSQSTEDLFKDQRLENVLIQEKDVSRAFDLLQKKVINKLKNYAANPSKYEKNKLLAETFELLKKNGYIPLGEEESLKENHSLLKSVIQGILNSEGKEETALIKNFISSFIHKRKTIARLHRTPSPQVLKREGQIIHQMNTRLEELHDSLKILKNQNPKTLEGSELLKILGEMCEWERYIAKIYMAKDKKSQGGIAREYALGSLDKIDKETFDGNLALDGFACVAKGGWVLHQMGLLHNDIATRNILVRPTIELSPSSKEPELKIEFALGDLGMSKLADEAKEATLSSDLKRPLRWIAPESLLSEEGEFKISDKSDVWSYGMTLIEFVADNLIRFFQENTIDQVNNIYESAKSNPEGINEHMRLCLKRFNETNALKFPQPVINLLEQIFHNDPSKRPNFHEIVQTLEEFKRRSIPLYEIQQI